MSLFKKKCFYCKNKIEKGKEVKREVNVLEFVGTRQKNFCSKEHADLYEKEAEERASRPTSLSCCG